MATAERTDFRFILFHFAIIVSHS